MSVRLIEAASNAQLWNERFEGAESDLFEMQDSTARRIISRLVVRLDDAGLRRSQLKPTSSLAAHEALLRGISLLRGYGPCNNEDACSLFELALSLDPLYGLAHSYLALGRLAASGYAFAPPDVLVESAGLAEKGVTLASEEPRCHRILAQSRLFRREHEAAEYHFARSLELNPFDADTVAQMGYLLALRGRPQEALAWMERARRLNPLHPDWYHYDRAIALYALADYRGAARELELVPRLGLWGLARLAACLAQLGETDRARCLLAEAARVSPGFSPLRYARAGIAFEHAADLEHIIAGLRKATATLP